LTIWFGILATTLALGMSLLGTLFEATNKIMGLFGGPLLGIFFLGVLSRRTNGSGALIGAGGGAVVGTLIAFSKKLLGVEVSFMWIAFSAAVVTVIVGRVASLFFEAPGYAEQCLVYRPWRADHKATT
jgi:sodium-coupled monocarboxylate transporter 8/12